MVTWKRDLRKSGYSDFPFVKIEVDRKAVTV